MMATKAVIYTRFSPRPNASDCDSCEKQAERCVAYCRSKKFPEDYPGFAIFKDQGVSGRMRSRPGLDHAIAVLRVGDVLVVDRSDRLARDMLVSLIIHAEVEQRGATIEFADGSPCRSTPEGKLFQNILAAFANFEREKFSERTKLGMAKKKKDGVWCGRPPYGFAKSKGVDALIPIPEEQSQLDYIFARRKNGATAFSICKSLHRNGLLFRGNKWTTRAIRRILKRNHTEPLDKS
jgi:site-specific DNA recombinase